MSDTYHHSTSFNPDQSNQHFSHSSPSLDYPKSKGKQKQVDHSPSQPWSSIPSEHFQTQNEIQLGNIIQEMTRTMSEMELEIQSLRSERDSLFSNLQSSLQAQNHYKEEARIAREALNRLNSTSTSRSSRRSSSSSTNTHLRVFSHTLSDENHEPSRKKSRVSLRSETETTSDMESEVEVGDEDSSRKSLDIFHSPMASPTMERFSNLSSSSGGKEKERDSPTAISTSPQIESSEDIIDPSNATTTTSMRQGMGITSPTSGRRSLRPAPVPPTFILNLPPQLARLKVRDMEAINSNFGSSSGQVVEATTPTSTQSQNQNQDVEEISTPLSVPIKLAGEDLGEDEYGYAESIISNNSLVTAEDGDQQDFHDDQEGADDQMNQTFSASSDLESSKPSDFPTSTNQDPYASCIPSHPFGSSSSSDPSYYISNRSKTPPPPLPFISFPPIINAPDSKSPKTVSPSKFGSHSSPQNRSPVLGGGESSLRIGPPILRERRSSLSLRKKREKKESIKKRKVQDENTQETFDVDSDLHRGAGPLSSPQSGRNLNVDLEPEREMEPTPSSLPLPSSSEGLPLSNGEDERLENGDQADVGSDFNDYPEEKTSALGEGNGEDDQTTTTNDALDQEATPPRYHSRLSEDLYQQPLILTTSSASPDSSIPNVGGNNSNLQPARIAIPPRTASALALFEMDAINSASHSSIRPSRNALEIFAPATNQREVRTSTSSLSNSRSIPNLSQVFNDQAATTVNTTEVKSNVDSGRERSPNSSTETASFDRLTSYSFNRSSTSRNPPLAYQRQRPQSISVPNSNNGNSSRSMNPITRSSFYDGLGIGISIENEVSENSPTSVNFPRSTTPEPAVGLRTSVSNQESIIAPSASNAQPTQDGASIGNSNNDSTSNDPSSSSSSNQETTRIETLPVPAYRPILPFRGTSLAYLPPAEQDRASMEGNDFNPSSSVNRSFVRSQTIGNLSGLGLLNHHQQINNNHLEVLSNSSRNSNSSDGLINTPPPPYVGRSSSTSNSTFNSSNLNRNAGHNHTVSVSNANVDRSRSRSGSRSNGGGGNNRRPSTANELGSSGVLGGFLRSNNPIRLVQR